MSKKGKIFSPTKQKVLLLLVGGLALGLARSPRQQKYIFQVLQKSWREIDRQYLYRIIREFKHERLVDYKEEGDSNIKVVITEKGREQTLRFNVDQMKIERPNSWDKIWRLVLFDIPETKRRARDALRIKLRELGFKEFQKSVFVLPYSCESEINFIAEFFEIRNYIHLAEVTKLSNDSKLRLHFDLPAE